METGFTLVSTKTIRRVRVKRGGAPTESSKIGPEKNVTKLNLERTKKKGLTSKKKRIAVFKKKGGLNHLRAHTKTLGQPGKLQTQYSGGEPGGN